LHIIIINEVCYHATKVIIFSQIQSSFLHFFQFICDTNIPFATKTHHLALRVSPPSIFAFFFNRLSAGDWQNRMGGSLKFFGGPPSFVYLCTIERAFRARKPLKNTMCVSQEHDVRFP